MILKNFKLLFFALLALPMLATAEGIFDYLAIHSYRLTKEKCESFNTRITFSLAEIGKRQGCSSLYNLDAIHQISILKKAGERLFFDLSAKELTDQLLCEKSKAENVFFSGDNSEDLTSLAEDIQKKIPALIEIKHEIQSRINRFQLIQGNIPKNPNNLKLSPKSQALIKEAEKLNTEAKELSLKRQIILESIPFSKNPEILELFDGLDESYSTDIKKLKEKLKKTASVMTASLSEDLRRLDGMKSNQETDYPRSFKERIAQDPGFVKNLIEKNGIDPEEFRSLQCEIDSKYGTGAVARDQLAVAGSTILTLGLTGITANLATKVPMLYRSFNTSRLLIASGAGTIINATQTVNSIQQQCLFDGVHNIAYSSSKDIACDKREIKRKLSENNCALAIALPAFGTTVSGLLYFGKMGRLVEDLKIAKESYQRKFQDHFKMGSAKATPINTKNVISSPVVEVHHFQKIQDLVKSGKIQEAREYESRLVETLSNSEMSVVGQIGRGVSGAKYVKFEDGTYGVWKPIKMSERGFNTLSGPAEVMAYKLDRYLNYNRVPTTVSRDLNGQSGTVQLMVGDLKNTGGSLPSDPRELRIFDYLIGNGDRHGGNYLITNDKRMVAIDHGLSAKTGYSGPSVHDQIKRQILEYEEAVSKIKRTSGNSKETNEKAAEATVSTKKAEQELRTKTTSYLSEIIGDKTSYTKLKVTSEEQWRKILGPQLNNGQIDSFLSRRKQIIDAVEKARVRFGDDIFSSK